MTRKLGIGLAVFSLINLTFFGVFVILLAILDGEDTNAQKNFMKSKYIKQAL